MADETVKEIPVIEVSPLSLDAVSSHSCKEELLEEASDILTDEELNVLDDETQAESEATHYAITALEEELAVLCREAIHTTSQRVLARCKSRLDGLMERLNDLRYEAVFLPIAEKECPHAATPARLADMKEYCRSNLAPWRIYGPDYQEGKEFFDFTPPDWLTKAEKQAILNAYRSPNKVRERITQLDMRCQDSQKMFNKFQILALRDKKARMWSSLSHCCVAPLTAILLTAITPVKPQSFPLSRPFCSAGPSRLSMSSRGPVSSSSASSATPSFTMPPFSPFSRPFWSYANRTKN